MTNAFTTDINIEIGSDCLRTIVRGFQLFNYSEKLNICIYIPYSNPGKILIRIAATQHE